MTPTSCLGFCLWLKDLSGFDLKQSGLEIFRFHNKNKLNATAVYVKKFIFLQFLL